MHVVRAFPGLTAVFATLLVATACGGGSSGPTDDGLGGTGGNDPPGALLLRILDAGEMSHVGTSQTWTARTPAEYATLWGAHRTSGSVPAPSVDFATEIVVAVFLGPRTSSGYGVDMYQAVAQADGAVILWDETTPGTGCPPGLPVVITPYAIAALTRVEGLVTYTGGVRPVPCPR